MPLALPQALWDAGLSGGGCFQGSGGTPGASLVFQTRPCAVVGCLPSKADCSPTEAHAPITPFRPSHSLPSALLCDSLLSGLCAKFRPAILLLLLPLLHACKSQRALSSLQASLIFSEPLSRVGGSGGKSH
ncbi:hypothetical protein KIL84_008681 [Mauremys mutica]|uniref:Uncharacterized protein n=1 Tax=Mauremys mutica TaxID=74926 RepID=A0A9D4AZN1_9SAUR|nr:hypothetical protein KIL84_008681 [Mauremys mutica]